MRPASASQDYRPEKPKGESMDARDERMERALDYDRNGEASTMAYVSSQKLLLVGEFMAWREEQYQLHRTAGETIFESLKRWEVIRFGGQLFPAAHGILAFWVRCSLAPEHGGRRLPLPGYFEHGPTQAFRKPATPDAMVRTLGREMTMPSPTPSRKAHQARVAELEKQRDGLNLDVDGGR